MVQINEKLHKFLLSTSARFTGQFSSELTKLSLSFPVEDARMHYQESPFGRTYLILTIEIDPETQEGFRVPNDKNIGEVFCILLSILYGKEFRFHGLLESHGIHMLPNFMSELNPLFSQPQYNSNPRKDLEIPLTLDRFSIMEPFLLTSNGPRPNDLLKIVIAAGKFYNRALSNLPRDPELAYLDLITCGEILSNHNTNGFTEEQLYDSQLLNYFQNINELENGQSIVNNLKSRLFQVKRKFTYNLLDSLNNYFFDRSETLHDSFKITREQAQNLIKNAYDLRSLYVHKGQSFGDFITPHRNFHNETVIGEPAGIDRDIARKIANSPTFLGLERMMRFCLLKLINREITISNHLDTNL